MHPAKELLDSWLIGGDINVTIQGADGSVSFKALLTRCHFVEFEPRVQLGSLEIELQSSGHISTAIR